MADEAEFTTEVMDPTSQGTGLDHHGGAAVPAEEPDSSARLVESDWKRAAVGSPS
jgi:hypothetical protein